MRTIELSSAFKRNYTRVVTVDRLRRSGEKLKHKSYQQPPRLASSFLQAFCAVLSNSCWYLLGIVKSRLALKDPIVIDYLGGNPGLVGFQPRLHFLRQLEIINQIEHGFIPIGWDAIEGRLVAVEDRHDIPTVGLDSAHRVL